MKILKNKLFEYLPGFTSYLIFGVLSLLTLILLKYFYSSEAASIFIYLNTSLALSYSILNFGFVEYTQVYLSNKGKNLSLHTPKIPLGLLIVLFTALLFSIKGLVENNILSSHYFIFVLLTLSLIFAETIYRIQLLSSNSFNNYLFQNFNAYLLSILLFCNVYLGNKIFLFLSLVYIIFIFKILMKHAKFRIFSVFTINKRQSSFYFKFLIISFLDNFLLFTGFANISFDQYSTLGIIIKIISPFFVLLNIYFLRRKVKIVSDLNFSVSNVKLKSFLLAILFLFFLYLSLSLFFSQIVYEYVFIFLIIKFFIFYLIYEFQNYLPGAPNVLIFSLILLWIFLYPTVIYFASWYTEIVTFTVFLSLLITFILSRSYNDKK